MPHHLQRQIDKLKKMILELGALVEGSLQDAIAAVQARDVSLAQRVLDGDTAIDQMEIDVEEECLHTLALHQPVAFDLRYVVAVLKINNDLERIGDLAVNIAEKAIFLAGEEQLPFVPFDLSTMSRQVKSMVKRSLDSLVNIDPAMAESVLDMDNKVDEIHRKMYDSVEQRLHEAPHEMEQLTRFAGVSRQLERIADHATNIAEDVLYLAKGEIFRHGRTSS